MHKVDAWSKTWDLTPAFHWSQIILHLTFHHQHQRSKTFNACGTLVTKSEFLRKPSKEKAYFLGATMKVNVLRHIKAVAPHTKQHTRVSGIQLHPTSILALEGICCQLYSPAALLRGKTRPPLHRRFGWSRGRSGWVQKISPQWD
jgi:hypothetical protein